MLLLKTCPKCKGDLQLRSDSHGKFISCIQCGYAKDFPTYPVEGKEKRPVAEAHAI